MSISQCNIRKYSLQFLSRILFVPQFGVEGKTAWSLTAHLPHRHMWTIGGNRENLRYL